MQSTEDKLAQQINDIHELTKENKNIDAAALLMSAFETHQNNLVPLNKKRWVYLVSIALPPFGLLYAIKYFFSDEEDAKHVAWACVVLTLFAVWLFWLFSRMLFSGSGVSPEQLQQVQPKDVIELTR